MGQLDGRITLVTGGTAGIGPATARRPAAEGATVYLTGRHQDEVDTAVAELPGHLGESPETSPASTAPHA